MSRVLFKVWGLSWAKWSCQRKRWKLPAGKNPANIRKTPANIRKSQNDGELTFSDSQGLGMAPLGSVALSNDMKHLKFLTEITGTRKLLTFSRRMNLQVGKAQWIATFLPFPHLHLLSSDSFSSLIFSLLLFSSLLFSSLALPISAFPSVHIVGSLTSKLPSNIECGNKSRWNLDWWSSLNVGT